MIYAFLFLSIIVNATLSKDLYNKCKEINKLKGNIYRLKARPKKEVKQKEYTSDKQLNQLINEAFKNGTTEIKRPEGKFKKPTRVRD